MGSARLSLTITGFCFHVPLPSTSWFIWIYFYILMGDLCSLSTYLWETSSFIMVLQLFLEDNKPKMFPPELLRLCYKGGAEKRLLKSHTMLKSGSTEAQPEFSHLDFVLWSWKAACASIYDQDFPLMSIGIGPCQFTQAFSPAEDLLLSLENRVPFGSVVCCHIVHTRAVLGRQGTCTSLKASTCWGLPQVGPSENSALLDVHFHGAKKPRDTCQQVRSSLTSGSRRAQSQQQARTHSSDIQKRRGWQAGSQSSQPPGASSFSHSWKEKNHSASSCAGVLPHWQALGWFRLEVVHIVLKTWWTHKFSSPLCLEWGQTAQRGAAAGFGLSLIINFSSRT